MKINLCKDCGKKIWRGCTFCKSCARSGKRNPNYGNHKNIGEKGNFKKGKDHVCWKGGRIKLNGYILIYSPDHPYPSQNKHDGVSRYVFEHRLVMEKQIGRYLLPNEIVHHKNCNRCDNRIENLELMTSGQNVGISNKVRPITESYKKKRSDLAKKFNRDDLGKFKRR